MSAVNLHSVFQMNGNREFKFYCKHKRLSRWTVKQLTMKSNRETLDIKWQMCRKERISGLLLKSLPFHRNMILTETAKNRKLPLNVIKLETMEQVESAPTPATIFSLFYKEKFITTDISAWF